MSYTKQTWQTGDIVTAEKLNNIEDYLESVLSSAQEESEDEV